MQNSNQEIQNDPAIVHNEDDNSNKNNENDNINNNNTNDNINDNTTNDNTNDNNENDNTNNKTNDNTNNNNTNGNTNNNNTNSNTNNNNQDNKLSIEQLKNKNGTPFSIVEVKKSMIVNEEFDKQYYQMGLMFYIYELRFKDKIKRRDKDINEVYIIEKSWYRKWKNFVNYNDIKKVASNTEESINNPFLYKINQNNNPGQIINSGLVIEEKPENLFSENDIPLKIKTKKEAYKIIPEVNFKKLYEVFGCDKIIKKTIRINKKKDFNREIDLITKEFNVIFLPTENVKCNELKEYKLYLTSLLNNEETLMTISDILNLNKNSEIKKNIGIEDYDTLNKFMRLYLSKDEKIIPEFKDKFN